MAQPLARYQVLSITAFNITLHISPVIHGRQGKHRVPKVLVNECDCVKIG